MVVPLVMMPLEVMVARLPGMLHIMMPAMPLALRAVIIMMVLPLVVLMPGLLMPLVLGRVAMPRSLSPNGRNG